MVALGPVLTRNSSKSWQKRKKQVHFAQVLCEVRIIPRRSRVMEDELGFEGDDVLSRAVLHEDCESVLAHLKAGCHARKKNSVGKRPIEYATQILADVKKQMSHAVGPQGNQHKDTFRDVLSTRKLLKIYSDAECFIDLARSVPASR